MGEGVWGAARGQGRAGKGTVQEKAVKMVSGLKATTYPLRCAKRNLNTLEKRREDKDMFLVHKLACESIFSDTNVPNS
jgi:hypothetical protein